MRSLRREATGRSEVEASLTLGRTAAWGLGLSLGPFALACAFAIDYLASDLSYRKLRAVGGPVAFELGVSHTRLLWIGMAMGATLLVSTASWLVWQAAAHATVARLGIEGTGFGPAFGLLAWVLPVGNLILPLLAVREIWRASEPGAGPRDWRQRHASLLLWAWWVCFLAGTLVAVLGIRHELGSHVLNGDLISRDRLLIVACWVGIVGAGLAGLIVHQINDRLFVRANVAPHGYWSGRARR